MDFPKHIVSAAGLVRNGKNEVLLVKSFHRGWEFPGGIVEHGESLLDGAKREIWEESGAQVEITAFVGVCKNVDVNTANLDFLCRYTGGTLRGSDETAEARWFTPQDALEAVTMPLTKARLGHMLYGGGKLRFFTFRKEPFEILQDVLLPAGALQPD